MKLWYGYGSEHSANLVLIGRFADVRTAKTFEETVRLIQEQTQEENSNGDLDWENPRFSEEVLKLLRERKAYTLVHADLLQFALDYSLEVKGAQVVIRTDETDVSAFLKLMIDARARVEVYSAHDYPETTTAPATAHNAGKAIARKTVTPKTARRPKPKLR